MPTTERRRFRRVTLRQPLRGAVGDARVYLVDGSLGGIRIVHQTPLPSPGAFCRVEVLSDLGPMKLDCEVVRTMPRDRLFQSGLAIVAADWQSTERLKSLFA
jgi:PilZ domain